MGGHMEKQIPQPIISVVAEYISDKETHATLDSLFAYADAPGEPPDGSKAAKSLAWLRRINKESDKPLQILGKLLEGYMEAELKPNPYYDWDKASAIFVDKVNTLLGKYGL